MGKKIAFGFLPIVCYVATFVIAKSSLANDLGAILYLIGILAITYLIVSIAYGIIGYKVYGNIWLPAIINSVSSLFPFSFIVFPALAFIFTLAFSLIISSLAARKYKHINDNPDQYQ